MDSRSRLILALLLASVGATTTKHMSDFINAVQKIESQNPGVPMPDVLRGLLRAGGLWAEPHLGVLEAEPLLVSMASGFVTHALAGGKEEGVVLALDGSSVALAPVLLGLEVGLSSGDLYPLTLAENMAASFLHHAPRLNSTAPLGSKGFWDSVEAPRVYALEAPPSLATDALLTGGVDGFILGSEAESLGGVSLSVLLENYYGWRLEGAGLDAAPPLISQNRRKNFRKLVSLDELKSRVTRAVNAQMKMPDQLLDTSFQMFVHLYTICPSIITRAQWGAAPFIGTPTSLALPVPYLFIHHTYQPSEPCRSFQQCVRDMRDMQRFHQQSNAWSDIGYSFVAGSDGNLYEGRGWGWVGAHTQGYNSVGYGLSFIGDYTHTLPDRSALRMVSHAFTECAQAAAHLATPYSLYGHRQAKPTECPGHALYAEIQTWEHYQSSLP